MGFNLWFTPVTLTSPFPLSYSESCKSISGELASVGSQVQESILSARQANDAASRLRMSVHVSPHPLLDTHHGMEKCSIHKKNECGVIVHACVADACFDFLSREYFVLLVSIVGGKEVYHCIGEVPLSCFCANHWLFFFSDGVLVMSAQ